MRRVVPVLASLSVVLAGMAVNTAPAWAARTESMTHWSCDRAAKADVSVTWISRATARVSWRITDKRRDGRKATIRIVGLDHNGSRPSVKREFFGGAHVAVANGSGKSTSGGRLWNPGLRKLDEVEVWIWTEAAGHRSGCGYNIVKRINDVTHSPARTAPLPYAKSKALRDRIVSVAWQQNASGYHEYGTNCSKYTNYFYSPNICMAWCANFAWSVWAHAGVPRAKVYNSSYTDDFADEWRVQFKPLGGKWKPAKGDVVVWSHRTDGINGHVGVVVATNGWNIKIVQGNWSDRVTSSGWINPFTSRQDGGNKRVIGFASPA
jgi:hypothetical protein